MTLRYLDQCHWGPRSLTCIGQLRPELQLLCSEMIRVLPSHLDLSIIVGHRNRADQDKARADGASTKSWPDSKHNRMPSDAFDFVPSPFSPPDWGDHVRFGRVVGVIECVAAQLQIPIRTGADWDMDGRTIDERLQDLGHVEWAGP